MSAERTDDSVQARLTSRRPSILKSLLRKWWLLFCVLPVLVFSAAALYPPVRRAVLLLFFETEDLFLFVGLPAAAACWVSVLVVRLLVRRNAKGIGRLSLKAAVAVVVWIAVVHAYLPAVIGGPEVWRAGTWLRLKWTVDVPSIRRWAASEPVCFQNCFQERWPEAVRRLHPSDVWVSGAEEDMAELTLSADFGTVYLAVGPKEMPPPDVPWRRGLKPLKLEDGAYMWCREQWQ